MSPTNSRHHQSILRTHARRPGSFRLVRVAAAGAMIVIPVACGSTDATVFSSTTTAVSASDGSSSADTAANTTDANAPETSNAESFPDGAEVLVSFTYESSAAQAKRPYVAVWVEDADGNYVDTITVWYEQGGKGSKYLSDLPQWYRASGADTTVSGATRVAGEYTVTWDGTDVNGDPVPLGDYVINIESAREHGSESFTSGTLTIGADGATVTFDDDGELSGAAATLAV